VSITERGDDGTYTLTCQGRHCAKMARCMTLFLLNPQDDLQRAKRITDGRADAAIDAIHDRFRHAMAKTSSQMAGGLLLGVGGVLSFTPLAPVGMALMGTGTVVSTTASIAGNIVQASKLEAISELSRELFACSEESRLIQALHHMVSINQGMTQFAVGNAMPLVDGLMGYYVTHPEHLAADSDDDACQRLQDMVDGTVRFIREGYASRLAQAALVVFESGDRAEIQVPDGTRQMLLNVGFGAATGIVCASCAWAGLWGASQASQMATVFKETGVSLVPRFWASNHHHFIRGAGSVAILAGLTIIIGGIIETIANVQEKDALVQKIENIRSDLRRLLDELSNMRPVGHGF